MLTLVQFQINNNMLAGVFSEVEVKSTVWSCDSSKSPGLDDFSFNFINICWEFLKEDIFLEVNEFTVKGRWPIGSNASLICLLPKVDNPQQLCDFRTISLVGCLYKIVSKLLSLRLEKVIRKVIDPRHSTFLKGRGLLDSVLVAMRS